MTAIKWSPRQKAAIDALGQNVLVSASAGAGKTSVLVARLMKRMEVDQVPIHHMVALTFTELAAMEMRKRLAELLNERAHSTNNPFLTQQIANLASAQITTIHGFCLTLIQNYSYVLGLDPAISQNVLDETQGLEFKNQAFEAVYQRFLVSEPDALSELIDHFDARAESHQNFKNNVFKLSNKLGSLDEPKQWLDKSVRAYHTSSLNELDEVLQALIVAHFEHRIEHLSIRIDQALSHLNSDLSLHQTADEKQLIRIDWLQESFKAMRDQLQETRLSLHPFDYTHFRNSFVVLSKIGFKNTLKPKDYPEVNKAIEQVKRSYEDTLSILFDEASWFEGHPQIAVRLDVLARFTLEFQAAHSQLKQKAKVMDFDDMEQYALAILKDTQFKIAAQLSELYQEIVIDEFQDTNEVQNRIVELISRGNNIFRVGDVKQSIYRFRNAKPHMMMGMMEDASMMHLVLDENYRSSASIVEFNNQLFDGLMNFPIFTQRYTQDDHVKVGLQKQQGGEAIELHLIQLDQVLDEDESSDVQEDSLDTLDEPDASPKAMYILSEIQRMLKESPYTQYKDYVILVRSNAQKAILKDLLQKARLPHAVSTKLGFYQADAIQDVLHLYHHLQRVHDDTHLVAVLLSPYFNQSEAWLAQLFIAKPETSSLSQHLRLHHPDITGALDHLKGQLVGCTLVETFTHLIHFNEMYTRIGFQDQTNLDLLIQKLSVAQDQNRTLREMIDEFSLSENSESSEAIVSTEEDDVIRVMTVHQSKGLEFKVVFFWSTSNGRIQDNVAPLLMDTDLGMSLQSISLPKRFTLKNPIRLAFEMKTIIEDVQEQLRLLYVALTRAQTKLVIVDTQPKWVLPLSTSTLLASPGSTPLIMAAFDQNPTLRVKYVAPVKRLEKVEVSASDKPIERLHASYAPSLSYQTPSATHHHGPRPRLNFARTAGTIYGTRIHYLFEHLPKDTRDVQTIYALDPSLSEQQVQDILAFYTHPLYQQLSQGEIKHEFPFYINLDQQVLHGYMDLVSLSDTIMVVDFKSDQLSKPQAFVEAYHEQITLYQRVLRAMYPTRPVVAYIYSLALREWIKL